MKLSLTPSITLATSGLSDRDLHGALDCVREELNRAIQSLSSTNEGPSDPTRLRGRVRELEDQLQNLEWEVIDRMLRREQTAPERCRDLTPQPASIWHDLPSDVMNEHLLPFLTLEEVVSMSEASMAGVAEEARVLLVQMVHELQELASLHPVIQESLTWMSQNPEMGGLGQGLLRFQSHLQQGMEAIGDTELQNLQALRSSISERLLCAQRHPEQRALQLVKTTLIGWLAKRLEFAPELRNDREIVLAAVQQDGNALRFASAALRNDREIVLATIQQHGYALYGYALYYASYELKNDREIVLAAVQQDGRALQNANVELRNDREIVLAAVQQWGRALRFANTALSNDREIVLAAVQRSGPALDYASCFLVNYQETVRALQLASAELRNDREIVLAAVQQDGRALQDASYELKNDREIVLAAVQRNGTALEYASAELRNDREIVLAAVQQNSRALQFAIAQPSPSASPARRAAEAAARPQSQPSPSASPARRAAEAAARPQSQTDGLSAVRGFLADVGNRLGRLIHGLSAVRGFLADAGNRLGRLIRGLFSSLWRGL